jgi:hypothetical protein
MFFLFLFLGANLFAQPLRLKVSHAPKQPRSDDPVKITAAPEGKAPGHLWVELQVVEPGAYIRRTDPAYSKDWREFPMQETNGAFTVSIPGDLQKNRRLIRYRFKTISKTETNYFPVLTNAAPNLAWFVSDGLPAWAGASKPGRTAQLTFSPEFLSTLPSYELIARADDARRSQWDQSYYRRPLFGTFVYEGEVYDHILFHNRGQASTYVAGKNKWGLKFNSGHSFAAKNFWGQPYKVKWSGINMNPCASAWAQVNRGMAGMDEAIAYRAYQLAGVPSPDTFWVQFRVIDSKEESASQYEGDLWGLYLVVEEKGGGWLRENGLPDGNIYSAESGPKHVVPGGPQNGEDLVEFRNGCERNPNEAWWRAHLDLPAYYGFHAINRLVANIDLRPDGNYYLYHKPDGHWMVLPHDLDMMFIPKSHQPGYVPQSACLEIPRLQLEFQNRAREILDLLASDSSPQGGQIGQVVAELAQKIAPPGQQRNWAELDEAIWNMHPRSHEKGQFYLTPYTDHRMGGGWQRNLATPDFAGFCQYIVEFCTDSRPKKNYRPNDGDQRGYGFGYLAYEANDPKIPARPIVTLTSSNQQPAFLVSAFSSPAGAKFSIIQWRIAEIAAPALKGYVAGKPYRYEIEPCWTKELTTVSPDFIAPPEACASERTYRARARYKDETGRWSHWSAPAQFVTPAAAQKPSN